MPLRFRKSVKIAPGVRLNIGKKSSSVTVGKKGASVNFGKRGVYGNLGIPGTGLKYRSKISGTSNKSNRKSNNQLTNSHKNEHEIAITISLLDDGSITFKDEKGNQLSDDYIRLAKSQKKDFILNWLNEHSNEKNNEIDSLLNIHLTTPPPDTEITFIPTEFKIKEPTPPQKNFSLEYPEKPTKKKYGFLASKSKIIKSKIDKYNEEIIKQYERSITDWKSAKTKYDSEYSKEYDKYLSALEKYKLSKKKFDNEQNKRRKFIEEDRFIDIDAMDKFLQEAFQSIIWPKETLISFEIMDGETKLFLDVDLPEIEDMPEVRTKVNKRDFKLTLNEISQTKKRNNYLTHIHAIGFRLIGEAFVSLPTLENIVFSGFSQRISRSTGNINDEYLYSVEVSRILWEELNFKNLKRIDVVRCFEEFNLRRDITRRGVISRIIPFQ